MDEATDGIVIDRSADVEHQEVLVGGAWWHLSVRILDHLQVPHGLGQSQHDQRVAALGAGRGPVQHLQAEAIDPRHSTASSSRLGWAMRRWLDGRGRARSASLTDKGRPLAHPQVKRSAPAAEEDRSLDKCREAETVR